MAKLLAMEWDDREARVAVATPRGSEVVVEDAFAIDISGVVSADATDDSREVGQRIAEVLAATRFDRQRCAGRTGTHQH